MGHYRYGAQKTGAASPLRDEKPQKHPKRRRAARSCPPGPATVPEHELSETSSIKPTRILTTAPDERSNRYAVVVERQIAGPTLPPHPLAKLLQQGRIGRRGLPFEDRRLNNALRVSQK